MSDRVVVMTDEEAIAALEAIRREDSQAVTRGLLDRKAITALSRAGWAARHKRGYPKVALNRDLPDPPGGWSDDSDDEESEDEQDQAQAIAEASPIDEYEIVHVAPSRTRFHEPPKKKCCRGFFSKWFMCRKKKERQVRGDFSSSVGDKSIVSLDTAQVRTLQNEVVAPAHQSQPGSFQHGNMSPIQDRADEILSVSSNGDSDAITLVSHHDADEITLVQGRDTGSRGESSSNGAAFRLDEFTFERVGNADN